MSALSALLAARYQLDPYRTKGKTSKSLSHRKLSHIGGGMILCLQFKDLPKIFCLCKFHIKWPNIELLIAFCAIWHCWALKGCDSPRDTKWSEFLLWSQATPTCKLEYCSSNSQSNGFLARVRDGASDTTLGWRAVFTAAPNEGCIKNSRSPGSTRPLESST